MISRQEEEIMMVQDGTLEGEFQPSVEMVEGWVEDLGGLVNRIGHHFARSEARERVLAYLKGLLSSVERKNSWQLAEAVGDTTPYGMQHLLGRADWDADAVRDELRRYVTEHLGDPNGVGILDETGFLKKGTKSVGVARQYSGTAGRVENCQIGVFLAYASLRGQTFLDRELYLHKEWAQDRERCREAGVPDEVEFATKPQLAKRMLERALDAGVPMAWVTGDEVYGGDRRLRMWLEGHQQPFVLAVKATEPLWWRGADGIRQRPAASIAASLAAEDWRQVSAGEGAKGPRLYDWARTALFRLPDPGWQHWLLVRRSLTDPTDLAYYVVFGPAATTLEEVVGVAGSRWAIEECIEAAKGEVGLDEYEVRSWTGWYRHITLSLLAHAYLTVTQATANAEGKKGIVTRTGSLMAYKARQRAASR
jgi:SRSO17 transposase